MGNLDLVKTISPITQGGNNSPFEEEEKGCRAPYLKGTYFSITIRDRAEFFVRTRLSWLDVSQYAYILHDKDVDENGELKSPHWHIYLHTKKQHYISGICKNFEVDPSRVEILRLPNKFLRYLVHRDNPEKHQYDLDEVCTNVKDFCNICTATLDDGAGTDDFESLYTIINTCGIRSYSSLIKHLIMFNPSLLKTATKSCYALSKYIEEVQRTLI